MALGFSAPIRADYNCLNFSVVDHIWGEGRGGFQTVKKRKDLGKVFTRSFQTSRFKYPAATFSHPDDPGGLSLGKKTWVHKTLTPPPSINLYR